MFVLNLAHFFTRLCGEGSRAANSKLTYIWTLSSRSYIVFALVTSLLCSSVHRLKRFRSFVKRLKTFKSVSIRTFQRGCLQQIWGAELNVCFDLISYQIETNELTGKNFKNAFWNWFKEHLGWLLFQKRNNWKRVISYQVEQTIKPSRYLYAKPLSLESAVH